MSISQHFTRSVMLGNVYNGALASPVWGHTNGCYGWQWRRVLPCQRNMELQIHTPLIIESIHKWLDPVRLWWDDLNFSYVKVMWGSQYGWDVHCLWTWEGIFIEHMQTLVSSISHSLFRLNIVLLLWLEPVFIDHKKTANFSITVLYLLFLNTY